MLILMVISRDFYPLYYIFFWKCNIGSVIDCFSVCYRQLKLQSGIPLPKHYRIIFECYESSQEQQVALSKTELMTGTIEKPVDVFNFGFSHEEQIKLVHSCQDALLKEQITLIESERIASWKNELLVNRCLK